MNLRRNRKEPPYPFTVVYSFSRNRAELVIDSGQFQRVDKKVVPETWQVLDKQWSAQDIIGMPGDASSRQAYVSSGGLFQALMAVPDGGKTSCRSLMVSGWR